MAIMRNKTLPLLLLVLSVLVLSVAAYDPVRKMEQCRQECYETHWGEKRRQCESRCQEQYGEEQERERSTAVLDAMINRDPQPQV